MDTVLSHARDVEIVSDPFPHVVIHEALDEAVYAELESHFPPIEYFSGAPHKVANQKYSLPGQVALDSSKLSDVWKQFVRNHVSTEFFQEFASVFGKSLIEYYPDFEQKVGKPLSAMTAALRQGDRRPGPNHPHDVVLDCAPYVDYTFTPRPFRGVHVDAPEEIYAGLLYFRDAADESQGGGLGIFRKKNDDATPSDDRTIRYTSAGGFGDDEVEPVETIEYGPNTLVFFLNSWRSLHGVLPRTPTIHPRRAAYIIAEIGRFPQAGLFSVESPKSAKPRPGPLARAKRIAGRVVRAGLRT